MGHVLSLSSFNYRPALRPSEPRAVQQPTTSRSLKTIPVLSSGQRYPGKHPASSTISIVVHGTEIKNLLTRKGKMNKEKEGNTKRINSIEKLRKASKKARQAEDGEKNDYRAPNLDTANEHLLDKFCEKKEVSKEEMMGGWVQKRMNNLKT